jgi:adenylate cyclase
VRLVPALLAINRLTLALTVMLTVVALFLARVSLLDLIELRTYDLRLQSRGPRVPSPAVVLAMIDEKSLDSEGRWPWPRTRLAALVDRLSQGGAKVIAFDIGFLEPAAAADDAALERAIRESSAAVVLGYFFHMRAADLDYGIDPAAIARQLETIAPSKYPIVRYRAAPTDGLALPRAYAPEAAVPLLAAAADSSGYFSLQQDPDGVVRRMPLVIAAGEDLFPPLAVVAAWHYLDRPPLAVTVGAQGVERVQIGERAIPTDAAGQLLIDYPGPPKTIPHVSISDILGGRVAADAFRDRIVVVGGTATGIYDERSTPFGVVYPGAEIHASVIDDVLTGRFIARPGWSTALDVAAIVLASALTALGLARLGTVPALFFAGGLAALYVVAARALLVHAGVWVNVVYPLLALVLTYLTITVRDYLSEQRERRRIRHAFQHYVAPAVIAEMLEDPSRLKLGGEERVLTVLFSDLQGFTSHSERYTPHQLFELLSEYYARMTERIFAHEGMLKEYVGDELMAIFGAPIEHAGHARQACAAALEMAAHRRALSEEWAESGRPALVARTGVNSGPMLVGNLGSVYRLSYGVLGDNVNLASRLEGLNKQYGTQILIGENTAALVGDAFVLREVDMVRVVGKRRPTRIYELLAATGTALPEGQTAALRLYAAGLAEYRARRWTDAGALFEQALAHWPEDGPSSVMRERCRTHGMDLDGAPPEDWDGVYEATRK